MIAVVLANPRQAEAFQSRISGAESVRVFCDDSRYGASLTREGRAFVEVNDFFLSREDWVRLNTWGAEKSGEWIRLCREAGFFGSVDLASALFLRFQYFLVELAKQQAYARKILDASVRRAVVFNEEPIRYPFFRANAILNHFLAETARERGLSVDELETAPAPTSAAGGSPIKEALRAVASRAWSSGRLESGARVLIHGALGKHLGPVLSEFRRRRAPVLFWDFDFQWKHFKECRRLGAVYRVLPGPEKSGPAFPERWERELRSAFEEAARRALFTLEGRDLSPLVERVMTGSLDGLLKRYGRIAQRLDRALPGTGSSGAFVTDEDTSIDGGFIAAYLSARGLRSFCVAHAQNPVNFTVSEKAQVFGLSETFAHCALGRDLYAHRGWDPERIMTTGTPRFDRLSVRRASKRRAPSAPKLLYCGAGMRYQTSDRATGYLGLHVMNLANTQKAAVEAVLRATERRGMPLALRPHNVIDATWRSFARTGTSARPVNLVSPREDFIRALERHDAMILAHWSTAILEAMLLGKPVILLDLFGFGEMADYAKTGAFFYARGENGLEEALDRLGADKPFSTAKDGALREALLGRNDGHAAERVVRRVLETLRKTEGR